MSLLSAIVVLCLVMDSLGNVPVFLAALRNVSPERYKKVVLREMLIALFALLLFLFFGHFILQWMKLTPAALSISGGLILLIISIKMIFPDHNLRSSENLNVSEPFIVPLAIPMVAGPTSMTMVMLMPIQAGGYLIPLAAVIIAWAFSVLVLLCSDVIRAKLKDKGLSALERLMGMILVVLAVQMLLDGIDLFLKK